MRWSAAFRARGFFWAMEARSWLRPSTSSPARFISISRIPTLTRMLSSTTVAGAAEAGRQRAFAAADWRLKAPPGRRGSGSVLLGHGTPGVGQPADHGSDCRWRRCARCATVVGAAVSGFGQRLGE